MDFESKVLIPKFLLIILSTKHLLLAYEVLDVGSEEVEEGTKVILCP
jgi:hypothetical protein